VGFLQIGQQNGNLAAIFYCPIFLVSPKDVKFRMFDFLVQNHTVTSANQLLIKTIPNLINLTMAQIF
jgi:hypothetical protein